jgi:hypothetical protein
MLEAMDGQAVDSKPLALDPKEAPVYRHDHVGHLWRSRSLKMTTKRLQNGASTGRGATRMYHFGVVLWSS